MSRLLGPVRPLWPWEDKKSKATKSKDKSPGRVVEESSKSAFLQPSHRYRILCRSKDAPRAVYLAARPDLMLVASIIIVAIWLFVCDMMLAMCRNFFYPQENIVEEGSIALGGDEKSILAYQLESEDIEAAVTPAISDL